MAFLKDWIQYAAGAIVNVKHCVGFHNVLLMDILIKMDILIYILMDILIKMTCEICPFTYFIEKLIHERVQGV